MTVNLQDGVYWINDCHPTDEDSDVHLHASSYLIRDDGKDILVDTGAFYNRSEIQQAIEALTGGTGVDAMIISKAHPPHAANLSAFKSDWGDPEIVATSGPPEMYGFVPSETKITAKSETGAPADVAGREFQFITPPLVDVAHSSWIHHPASGLLVTADGFGHLHADGDCELTSADFETCISYENIYEFHKEMLLWLRYVDPGKIRDALETIFDENEISIVAPIHGSPIFRDDLDGYLENIYRSVDQIVDEYTIPPAESPS